MLRSVALFGFVGLLAAVLLAGPSVFAADTKDPPPFVKIMEDNFSGKKNVHKAVKRAVEADSTDWAEVDKLAKQYVAATQMVGQHAKTKPEKGGADSWAKLTGQFAAQGKELDGAVAKKDKEKVKATVEKLMETCEACHENHR